MDSGIRKRAFFESTGLMSPSSDVTIFPARGFHIYSRLRLKMELEAPESEDRIRRFMEVIHRYAEVATSLVSGEDLVLLELQGETLHLFMPCQFDDQSSIEAIALVTALHAAIEQEVKGLAGDGWKSLRFTMDHGDTLLVDSSQNSDDSVISLSPAANEPAKQFKRDSDVFPSGCLRLRKSVLDVLNVNNLSISTTGERDGWVSLQVDDPSSALSRFARFTDQVQEFRKRIEQNVPIDRLNKYANLIINRAFSRLQPGSLDSPLVLRGWTLRADLDGFSSQVRRSFENPNQSEALKILVGDFIQIMNDASLFDSGCPFPAIGLPWAGDCASRFIVSTDEAYEEQSKTIPAQVQHRWQEQTQAGRWVCSLAGGNKERGNGFTLLAELTIQNRRFQIEGGWGIRRSKQGEQDVGGNPTECVMHSNDVAELNEAWRKAYTPDQEHPSFAKAGFQELKVAQIQAQQLLDAKREVSKGHSITTPKPYYDQSR